MTKQKVRDKYGRYVGDKELKDEDSVLLHIIFGWGLILFGFVIINITFIQYLLMVFVGMFTGLTLDYIALMRRRYRWIWSKY